MRTPLILLSQAHRIGKYLHKEDHKANQERKQHQLDTRYSDDQLDLGNIGDYEEFEEVASILETVGDP